MCIAAPRAGMKSIRHLPTLLGAAIIVAVSATAGWAGGASSVNDWASDQLIVQVRGGVPDDVAGRAFADQGGAVVNTIPALNSFVLKVPPARLDAVQKALAKNPNFKSVSKDYLRYLQTTTPNDHWYGAQWYLPQIGAPQAWDTTIGNANTIIGVVDSGVTAVPDLAPKLLPGIDLVDGTGVTSDGNNHGTPVAGIAAAASNNSIGVAGVAWLNDVLPVKIFGSTGTTTCSLAASGIIAAADNGAKVINMSFAGTSGCSSESSAIGYAWSKGAVLVAAAGNSSSSAPAYPAAYSNVLAVGSVDQDGTLDPNSNYGSWISVVAPGCNLYTTYSNGGYAYACGTSVAAPVVSGVAALILAANPSLSNSQVESIIEQTADDLGAPGFDSTFGWGRVNAYKAVLAATSSAPLPPDTTPPTASITSPANGASVSGAITVAVSASDNVGVSQVQLYLDGALFATDTISPFSFAWDTTTVANGSHSLQAAAYDAAGNSGASATIAVNVSNGATASTPPTVNINSPVDGSTVSGTVKVTVAASDGMQITSVQAFADGKSIGSTGCATNSCTVSFNWNTKKVSKGSHTLTANATDAAGNTGTSSPVTVNH